MMTKRTDGPTLPPMANPNPPPPNPIPTQGVRTMTTKTKARSSMTTLEDALERVNTDPCSTADLDGVNSDQGLNIKEPKDGGLEEYRRQVREALEARVNPSGNGDPKGNGTATGAEPKTSGNGDPKGNGSNGDPAKTAKVNGSDTVESVPVEAEEHPFTDQADEDMQKIQASLEEEAAGVERLETELAIHSQHELEAYKSTREKADEVSARKEQAQLRMLGALAGAQTP